MICAGGGAKGSSVCRVRCAWKKFRELVPMLTLRDISFKLKSKLYNPCIRSAMIFSSEIWAVKKGDIRRLERTDFWMIRCMCVYVAEGQKVIRRVKELCDSC